MRLLRPRPTPVTYRHIISDGRRTAHRTMALYGQVIRPALEPCCSGRMLVSTIALVDQRGSSASSMTWRLTRSTMSESRGKVVFLLRHACTSDRCVRLLLRSPRARRRRLLSTAAHDQNEPSTTPAPSLTGPTDSCTPRRSAGIDARWAARTIGMPAPPGTRTSWT